MTYIYVDQQTENLTVISISIIQFDWIYLTGDLPAHNVWNQTREDQLYILEVITHLLKMYLPDKVVYPALGKHEGAPVNRYT